MLSIASIKATFSDDFSIPNLEVEHMWVNEIYFDGISISGVLLNSPLFLKSISKGDRVSFPLDRLDDWLCVIGSEIYGGYTIQTIRSKMNDEEIQEHDAAWRLNFPTPDIVQIPERDPEFDITIAEMMAEQIKKQPELVNQIYDDEGRTLLHLESLYGKIASVKVLLEHGASPKVKCDRGWTPLDYAKSIGWNSIIAVLEKAM